jgi:hypothetical protein
MAHEKSPPSIDEILSVDLSAIAPPDDKIAECHYFLALAEQEPDREKFRWLISAFLNAVYSYFEIKALAAYEAYSHGETGEYIANEGALVVLRQYLQIKQVKNKSSFVKTSGFNRVCEEIYEIRKQNTHHYPLSILQTQGELPEAYTFGCTPSNAIPALRLCRNIMSIIENLETELNRSALIGEG